MRLPFLLLLAAAPALAQDWVTDCGLEPPDGGVVLPVPRRVFEPRPGASPAPPVSRLAGPRKATAPAQIAGVPTASLAARGALTGKTVYLSAGHGFTWTAVGGGFDWRTQRGTTHEVVEDLVSEEAVNQHLVPMLLLAGAQVVTVREADRNPNLVLVDDGEAGYLEQGSATFQTSTLPGFGRPVLPMDGDTLPFSLGTNRLMTTAATVTGSATWTAQVPEDGFYAVHLSWTSFTARVTDAHVVVRHGGGETHFRLNQQRHGGTWVLLGTFYFRADRPAQVVALNDSVTVGGNVSLDAVRFGGGLGLTTRIGNAAGVSGRPRAEEAARYHAQFSGAPAAVFAPTGNTPPADRGNDVATRSRFAAWVHEPGEDAVYLAWHTNAFNGVVVGSNTYVYGPNPPDGTYTFTGVAGSDRLAQLVHGELVRDLRASSGWNKPGWRDFGVDSAYFGELNPAHNPEMPAVLVEVAFHDAAADARELKEPGFRAVAARALLQGIISFFAEKDGVPARLPPEPPTRVRAEGRPGGEALLRWSPGATDTQGVRGDAATSYRVYASEDGLGWDDGVPATTTELTVRVPPGVARYFRVAGVNEGGESFPSAVVGVRLAEPGRPLVLVLNGFDRLDAAMAPRESFAERYALGTVLRLPLLRMNDGSSTRLHGEALAASLVGFDSADAEAFAAGLVSTAPYALLDWYAGRGQAGGAAPPPAAQALLDAFHQAGGPVLFSGEAGGDQPFLGRLLSASVDPGPTSRSVSGVGVLRGLEALALGDTFRGAYDVGLPPGLAPVGNGVTLARYSSGTSAAVGVAGQTVGLGFPLEGVVEPAARAELFRRALIYLAVTDGGLDAGPDEQDAGGPALDGGEAVDAGTGELEPVRGSGCATTSPGHVLFVVLALTLRRLARPAGLAR